MTSHGGCPQGDCTLRAEHTPRHPPQTPWGNTMGNEDPDVDDQEVIFLRGEGWVPLEQPFQPPACAQPDGGGSLENNLLIPQEDNLLAPSTVQSIADVGCLISTLATGLQLSTPHINTFSGNATPGKTEVSLEQWYHEV